MRTMPAGLVSMVAAMVLAGCSVTIEGTASPVAAPAGTTAVPAPRGDLFADDAGRFGIVPPEGWVVDRSGRQGAAVLFLSRAPDRGPAGPFTANVNVLVAPSEGADLQATVLAARRELAGLPGYRPLEDEPVVLDGGVAAHLLGGTFSDSGFELRNLQVFAVDRGMAFVVTGTALSDTWADHGDVFDASLRTLTVDP